MSLFKIFQWHKINQQIIHKIVIIKSQLIIILNKMYLSISKLPKHFDKHIINNLFTCLPYVINILPS